MEFRRILSLSVGLAILGAGLYGVWLVIAAGRTVAPWVMVFPLYVVVIGGGWALCDLFDWDPPPRRLTIGERVAAGDSPEDIARDIRARRDPGSAGDGGGGVS